MPIENIEGVAYKKNDKVIKIERPFIKDLDKLPFPAYDLINVKEYLKSEFIYAGRMYEPLKMTIISSRGCPYNCVFCSIKLSISPIAGTETVPNNSVPFDIISLARNSGSA